MSRITVCLDCPLYQTGGWCKHKRKDVGALQPACDHAKKMNETFNPEDKEEEPMTDMNTRTEATKLCKKCGRELTLDHFGKKNGTKDGLQYWCKECTTQSILKARRAKKAAKAQAETVKEPKPESIVMRETLTDEQMVMIQPKANPKRHQDPRLKNFESKELADDLRHRGWDVKATRPKTIIEEL